MNRFTAFTAAVALLGAGATAQAQGTITSGTATFDIDSFSTTGASVDLTASTGGDDHMFGTWWWYRMPGDTDENPLPSPDTDTYSGNVATLSWTDVDSSGLDMELVITLTSTGSGDASLEQVLTVTNTNGTPASVVMFGYADIEMDGTAGSDMGSAGTSATSLVISETSTATFSGPSSMQFQVDDFPNIRSLFSDGAITNLDGSGLPFGPDDWTGAFQWMSRTIAAGGTTTYTMTVDLTEGVAPGDGGVADGGIAPTDAGVVTDGGTTTTDGGTTTTDGGVTADAGTTPGTDAGTTPGTDAGATPGTDAGTTPMADGGGTTPGVDAGTGGPVDEGGCSCRVQTDPSPSPAGPLAALVAVGALVLRRRRR